MILSETLRSRDMATTKTRTVGTCQICEREHKLLSGKVVHHGYQRPGDGEIHGDCFGVGHAPYELSCECLKAYREWLIGQLEAAHEFLGRLTKGEVTELYAKQRDEHTWKTSLVKITPATPSWAQELKARIWQTQNKIRGLEQESQRVSARIDGWKPVALKTFEEVVQAETASKAAKAALRAEKARIKAEAEAAKKARQEARQAAWAAKVAVLAAEFKALAAEENPAPEAVRKLVERAKKLDIWGAGGLNLMAEAEKLGVVNSNGYWRHGF